MHMDFSEAYSEIFKQIDHIADRVVYPAVASTLLTELQKSITQLLSP